MATPTTPSALANQITDLGNTANTLLQNYKNKTITLQQLKDSVNTSIIATFNTIEANVKKDITVNDADIHSISKAIRMIGSPE